MSFDHFMDHLWWEDTATLVGAYKYLSLALVVNDRHTMNRPGNWIANTRNYIRLTLTARGDGALDLR